MLMVNNHDEIDIDLQICIVTIFVFKCNIDGIQIRHVPIITFFYNYSSAHNGIYIYHRQNKDTPEGIPNPHSEFKQTANMLLLI